MAEVMQPGVSLAVIAALQMIVFAVVQATLIARKEKRDYARQDLVAERVADAAAAVAEVARLAADADRRTQAKLMEIHILVNSDMTAARTAERDAIKLLVVALKQVVTANTKLDIPSPHELINEIERAEMRIVELDDILADRHAAQVRVEQQTAKPKALSVP